MAKKIKKETGSKALTLPDNTHIEGAGLIESQRITHTLESNYMPYAMSVIMSRAIPEIDGFKPSPYGLYETAATMNNTWGYFAADQNWKDANKIAEIKKKLNGMGINYLLNVGPDHLGRFPAKCQEILKEVAKTF